jgi:hypothetical protein
MRTCASTGHSCERCGSPLNATQLKRRARFCRAACRAAASRRCLEGPEGWRSFVAAVSERLSNGAATDSGSAETRPLPQLGRELEEDEALNLAGWSFFVWLRAVRLRQALEETRKRTT